MKLNSKIHCPQCEGKNFVAKYESTYVYSYKIQNPDSKEVNPVIKNEEALPFLFDNREQKNASQYIECDDCGEKYPCEFTMDAKQIDFTILQKAIRSDHVDQPYFFG
ncbi:hypothetical protein RH915_05605 [Serpentinicella sp. ANB-PHB4]|uniref:hypothetical protein n=1 Tax=Serpentinicella sp. ANB-PHB4 TaxID=3074076 RepID=UPI00285CB77E|nr:hypothetical protein [Serpentinicella sp. ANB-PHB4]MDR5658958.1 hypothetical protein [Serpentinicella sp. ANB-PHB4]